MSGFVRRALLVLLSVLLLMLAVTAWLAGTGNGLQLLWRYALAPALPALSIGSLQGRLAGSIELADLRYEDEQLLFSAQRIRLRWDPAALRHGRWRVRALAAQGVRYEQRGGDQSAAFELPPQLRLPFAIELQSLALQDLVVITRPGAEPFAIDHVTLSGAWQGRQLALQQLSVQRPGLEITGELALQTAADYPLTGNLHWQATPPGSAPLQAAVQLSGSLQALRVQQTLTAPCELRLDLQLLQPLAALQLDGLLELQACALATVRADLPDMKLSGHTSVHGPPGALQLSGQLHLVDPQSNRADADFSGVLRADGLQVTKLQLVAPDRPMQLHAQGRIGFGTLPSYDFTAQWQSLAWPLQGAPEWQSALGELHLQGDPSRYRFEGTGELYWRDRLNGKLALRVRSGDGPDSWVIEQATLSGGKARVEASGAIGSRLDLQWRIDAARLGDLVPGAGGSLTGKGQLTGSRAAPIVQARIAGSDIVYTGYRVGSLALDADLGLPVTHASRLHAVLESAVIGALNISRITVQGHGNTATHQLTLQADTSRGSAGLNVTGHWDDPRWRFDLHEARLAYPALAPWQLAQAFSGEIERDRVNLPQHCWNSAAAQACFRLQGDVDNYAGGFSLSGLSLDYFSPLLPEAVSLEGTLGGTGSFSAAQGRAPVLDVQLVSTPIHTRLPQAPEGAEALFDFAAGRLELSRRNREAHLNFILPQAGGGGVRLQANLTAPGNADWLQAVLAGELKLDWPDIAPARYWLPEVSELQGRLTGHLAFDGTVRQPRLLGRVELAGAKVVLATPEITLEDIAVTLDGQPDGAVQISARARSGAGEILGSGTLDTQRRSATLMLKGQDFQVMNTAEAQLFASPDLRLVLEPDAAHLSGEIAIPRARLRPRRPPPSAVSVSPDQVIVVEGDSAAGVTRFPVDSRVRIVLGKDVTIDGLGLSGRLGGAVLITNPPGQPVHASGALSISDGRYEAYGQQLTITTGRLLFSGGAVTEPGIDIEAVRKPASDIEVGVRARGSLRAPVFSLFSNPVMPQQEQLSWLVLGRSMRQQASDSERSALQTAALMLGLNQGESLGKRLGEQIGLDEISITQEPGADLSQAALLVGKYLTPTLFVSYGIGLFEPVSVFRVRYALSSRWKLEGEASALSSAADLFYEIQRRK